MTKRILVLSIFLLFFSALKAEVVENIIIEGNKRISDETIKIYGDIEIKKNFTESDINKVLSNLNSTNFFKNIEINLDNKTLKIVVEEYPFVNQLIILGEPKKGNVEEIKKLIQVKSKRPFIKANLTKDIDIIKKLYSSLGYNFAKVDTKIKNIDKILEKHNVVDEENSYYVYTILLDSEVKPRTQKMKGKKVYIGQTGRHPLVRLLQHQCRSKRA